MAWTPPPIGPDVVEPLGPDVRQEATDARLGGQRHDLPTLVLGVLVAAADVAVLDGEETALRQRDPVDIPAPVVQHLCRAGHARFPVDDPACGPEGLGQGQVGALLTHAREQPPATERREGMDGHQGGRTGGSPLGPVGGDPTGRHQTGHRWMIDEDAGPGVEDAADAHEPADIRGGCGTRDEGWGRGAAQDMGASVLMTTDDRAQLLGHGKDHVHVGEREACLTPLFQPGCGREALTRGATAVPAGGVDVVCLAPVLARPQVSASGLGATVDEVIPGAAVAGPEVWPTPLQVLTPAGGDESCADGSCSV